MRLDILNGPPPSEPSMDDVFCRHAELPKIPLSIWWTLIKNINLLPSLIALFLSPLLFILVFAYYIIRFIYRSTYYYFKNMRKESNLSKFVYYIARNIYNYCGHAILHIVYYRKTLFIKNTPYMLICFADLLLIVFRFNMAGKIYLKLIHQGVDSKNILFKNMMASYLSSNAFKAFDAAKMMLATYPNDYNAALLLAHTSVKAKYEYQAITLLLSINNSYSIALAAILLTSLGKIKKVSELLVNFSRQEPQYAESAADYLLFKVGNRPAALAAFKAALDFKPTKALLLKQALALGPAEPNVDEVRQSIRLILDDLLTNPLPLDNSTYLDSFSSILMYGRYNANLMWLQYFGGNNLDIFKNSAKVTQKLFPAVNSINIIKTSKPLANPHLIKYGFFAEFLDKHVADFWAHLLNYLPRDIFEVVLFIPKHLKAHLCSSRLLSAADKIVQFPYLTKNVPLIDVHKAYGEKALSMTRDIVAAESLDIFHNPFCPSDIISQYLSFSRLALVQIVDGGGHSTYGLPEIDYKLMYSHGFISEPDEWFSEKLAFLRGADEQLEKHLSPFGTNLTDDNLRKDAQINKPLLKRSDFGLPEARPLYLCIQDLGRRHPETDALFAELLKRDKDAFLLVSSHELHFGNPNVFDSFKHSLASYGLKNINERIFRVPLFTNRPKHDYFSFLKLADCLLIFRRFLGGQIFLDTLGQELPVISWPTDDYAGLLSVYRFLGLEELLAKSQDEYINLAMCMAHDKKWATDLQLRLKIGKARYLDYSQRSGFYKQDLSQFLQMAVERARAGLPPAHWRAGQFYDQLNADQLKEFIRAEQNVILNEDY